VVQHKYSDALNEDHEEIVLVSGDSDQAPAVDWILSLNMGIEIHGIIPSYSVSKDLRRMANILYHTNWKRLHKCQNPNPAKGEDFKVYKLIDGS
jgi:uncharacterized LabA/DUF88 family protein